MSILNASHRVEERNNRWLAAVNGIDLDKNKTDDDSDKIDEYEAASFGLAFNSEGEV